MLSTMIFCFICLIFQDLLSYSDRQRAAKTELPPIEVGWGIYSVVSSIMKLVYGLLHYFWYNERGMSCVPT